MSVPSQAGFEQVKLSMATTNGLFISEVVEKRNLEALEQIYTAGARLLPPGAPLVSGRAAIKEFWANMIQSANPSSAVLRSVDVMPAGEGAVEIGSCSLAIHPEGQGKTELQVKYVVFWKQEDGKWKWHVDIWNENA